MSMWPRLTNLSWDCYMDIERERSAVSTFFWLIFNLSFQNNSNIWKSNKNSMMNLVCPSPKLTSCQNCFIILFLSGYSILFCDILVLLVLLFELLLCLIYFLKSNGHLKTPCNQHLQHFVTCNQRFLTHYKGNKNVCHNWNRNLNCKEPYW